MRIEPVIPIRYDMEEECILELTPEKVVEKLRERCNYQERIDYGR